MFCYSHFGPFILVHRNLVRFHSAFSFLFTSRVSQKGSCDVMLKQVINLFNSYLISYKNKKFVIDMIFGVRRFAKVIERPAEVYHLHLNCSQERYE